MQSSLESIVAWINEAIRYEHLNGYAYTFQLIPVDGNTYEFKFVQRGNLLTQPYVVEGYFQSNDGKTTLLHGHVYPPPAHYWIAIPYMPVLGVCSLMSAIYKNPAPFILAILLPIGVLTSVKYQARENIKHFQKFLSGITLT